MQDALEIHEWKEAILEEMKALEKKWNMAGNGAAKGKEDSWLQMGVHNQV